MNSENDSSKASSKGIPFSNVTFFYKSILLISLFLLPSTFLSALLTLFAVEFRSSKDHGSLGTDLLIIFFFTTCYHGSVVIDIIRPIQDYVKRQELMPHTIFLVCSTAFLLFSLASSISPKTRTRKVRESEAVTSEEPAFLRPLVFPSRTKHSRRFPKQHSFSYSYLFVGVPVNLKDAGGSLITVNNEPDSHLTSPERGWFSVNAEDHLFRGRPGKTLEEKLRDYLCSQGVQDSEWESAYLITAPRFLGYSFNPVSFWYIYTAARELAMMVLEVNNTFDERRMYLLRRGDGNGDNENPSGDDGSSSTEPMNFSQAWPKDFHVSPFNSVKGSYAVLASDPFHASHQHPKFFVTITLSSSDKHAKLVARAFSTLPPLHPSALPPRSLARARVLLSWCWTGFATYPRIVREAARLFFRRGLHVWYRPEVAPTSIGRRATVGERVLAAWFFAWISEIVVMLPGGVEVALRDVSLGEDVTFKSASPSSAGTPQRAVTLTVLTPAFYARFASYSHAAKALERESLLPPARSRTLLIEGDSSVVDLLIDAANSAHLRQSHSMKLDRLESLRWVLLRGLRCSPAPLVYPSILSPPGSSSSPSSSTSSTAHQPSEPASAIKKRKVAFDSGSRRLSELDVFVRERSCVPSLSSSDPSTGPHTPTASAYRRVLTSTFLSHRFAGGLELVVEAADLVARAGLCWAAVVGAGMRAGGGTLGMMREAVLVLGVHLWAIVVKGL